MILGLDPGHGGYDNGAKFGSNIEKEMNLYVAHRVERLLSIKTVFTRETDKYVSLVDRANILNRAMTDINVSIHHNAVNGKAKGFEIYHYTGSKQGRLLANAVGNEFKKSRPMRFIGEGMMIGNVPGNYFILRATSAPTILTEYGFLDNPNDVMCLDKQAEEIANGVMNYFGKPLDNDEDLVDKLIAKGVVTDKNYWLNVLKTGSVEPAYLRIAFKNFIK